MAVRRLDRKLTCRRNASKSNRCSDEHKLLIELLAELDHRPRQALSHRDASPPAKAASEQA